MKKRRIIALLLSVLIMTAVVFSAPFSVSAAEVRESVGLNIPASGQKGDIYWSFDSSTSTLTLTGKGDMSFHVYWAAGGSGNEDTSIKKVVISSGITSISKYAFGLCTELEEVVLGYGLKRIGFGAFRSCKKLRELKTPTSLETIEDRAFDKCVSLSRTVLNPGLKKIGSYAFTDVKKVTFMIPESVTSIGKCAIGYYFDPDNGDYKAVKDDFLIYAVEGSAGSRYADNNGFSTSYCTWYLDEAYNSLTVNAIDTFPAYLWSHVYDLEKEGIDNGLPVSVVFDDRITEIESALACLYNARSVTFPKNLERIKSSAFRQYDSLTSVTFPKTLKYIGSNAFMFCGSLKNVTLNYGLEEIGSEAFADTALTSVTIPPTVKQIGNYAFGFDWTGKKLTPDFTIYGEQGSEAQRYAEKYGFNFIAVKYIRSVNLNFTEPKAGEYPDYNLGINNCDCEVVNLEILTPHGTGLEFTYIDKDGKFKMLEPDEKFQKGIVYTPAIMLMTSKENTYFAGDVEVTFNGKKAQVSPMSSTWISASRDYSLKPVKLGDVNGDGVIDVTDATYIQMYAAGLIE